MGGSGRAGLAPEGEFEARRRFAAEADDGLVFSRDRRVLTPFAGLTLEDGGGRVWRAGARRALRSAMTLNLEGSRRMPAVALAILNVLPRINDWALTTGRDAPVTYWMVRKVFGEAACTAGLVDVRLHDLRRTIMTRAAMVGVGTHVLRDLLGHKTTAIADRYVRDVGNPVRDARKHVGEAMAAMMQGETGEFAPIWQDG